MVQEHVFHFLSPTSVIFSYSGDKYTLLLIDCASQHPYVKSIVFILPFCVILPKRDPLLGTDFPPNSLLLNVEFMNSWFQLNCC